MGFEFEECSLPSGKTVRLRPLNGYEVIVGRKRYPDDRDGLMSACLLGCSLSDPGVDLRDAMATGLAWMQSNLAGDLQPAIDHVERLSGLGRDARKSVSDPTGD